MIRKTKSLKLIISASIGVKCASPPAPDRFQVVLPHSQSTNITVYADEVANVTTILKVSNLDPTCLINANASAVHCVVHVEFAKVSIILTEILEIIRSVRSH